MISRYLTLPCYLGENDRIEILTNIGYSDRVRTHEEVSNICNDFLPEINPISHSMVTKTLQLLNATSMVKNIPRTGIAIDLV